MISGYNSEVVVQKNVWLLHYAIFAYNLVATLRNSVIIVWYNSPEKKVHFPNAAVGSEEVLNDGGLLP